MTPTQEDHEAAARKLVQDARNEIGAGGTTVAVTFEWLVAHVAAALSEAVRVAVAKEREACWQIAIDAAATWEGTFGPRLGAVFIAESIRARSDAQATPAPEPVFDDYSLEDAIIDAEERGTPPETGEK